MTVLQWVGVVFGWMLGAAVTGVLWGALEEHIALEAPDEDGKFGWSVVAWPALLIVFCLGWAIMLLFWSVQKLGQGLRWVALDSVGDVKLWLERRKERANQAMDRTLVARLTVQSDPFLEQARKEVDAIAPEAE